MPDITMPTNVSTSTNVWPVVEHHHPDDELVVMRPLGIESNDVGPTFLTREIFECPRCQVRVTLRLMVRSVVDVNLAAVTIDGVEVQLVELESDGPAWPGPDDRP